MKIRIIIILLSLFIISQEVVLSQFDFQIAFSSITCNGLCDGNATVNLISTQNCGNGPYQYQIIGPSPSVATTTSPVTSATSHTFANLCAGSYSVNVLVSGNVCTSGSFNIIQPPLLYTSISTILPLCAGNDGSALIIVNGGQPSGCANSCRGYNVLWTGPGGIGGGSLNACPKEIVTCSQSSPTNTYSLTNLSPGTYNVTIEDHNNCPVSTSFTIIPPPPPITVSGLVANNSIDITVSGGTAPYAYSWSNGAITQDVTNLSPGTYTVTLTDANGCLTSQSFTIQNQNPPLAISGTPTNSCCAGAAQGSILVVATGGSAPYNVSWSGPVSGNPAGNEILTSGGSFVLAGLMAGSYTVLVTDASGNSQSVVVTVTEPLPLAATSVQSNTLCSGTCTGSINLTVTGGVAPYLYSWTGIPFYSSSNEDLSNLCPGVYTVSVTDACGCTNTLTQVITAPPAFTLTGMITQIPCGGGNNGAIDVTVGGGTPGYTYAWTGPSGYTANTEDLLNLTPGTYTLTATDANNCTITQNWVVNPAPQALLLSETNVDVLCSGQATGSIDLTTVGGTAPYTYMWNGPGAYTANTQDISGLAAGTYSVTVTDANNCTVSLSNIDITASPTLVLTGSVNGNNIDISVSGGTVPYNYSWSNGAVTQDLPNVLPGTYVVIVTDAYNCAVSDTFVVNNAAIEEKQLDEITLFPNPTNDQLTIRRSVNSLSHHSYVIEDSYGRKVLEGSFEDSEETLSIGHLAPGLYQLHAGVKTKSFVVIH